MMRFCATGVVPPWITIDAFPGQGFPGTLTSIVYVPGSIAVMVVVVAPGIGAPL